MKQLFINGRNALYIKSIGRKFLSPIFLVATAIQIISKIIKNDHTPKTQNFHGETTRIRIREAVKSNRLIKLRERKNLCHNENFLLSISCFFLNTTRSTQSDSPV